ncbi:F0F1 ATP synthase subunit delta [Nocardioides jiangxiensis]|uniref:ATP synthase subunit delta n=1 Tax=Nocardioides jiangxiensis TaxID=3064524 RepID=A0ABT9B117_9ACTN|nr:F0F1 ATP synthase subunit delta [Nocardioides sp. WY-20]MDO7867317.1 F0F1 ATP synthase subunit delta [Nocardioides sp. WY-20]
MTVPAGIRGASAEALATLSSQLEGAADAATTGAELFSVAAVLRAEPALRRIATDVSILPEAKSGLAEQVFGSHVSAATLGLVTSAFSQRWTTARDLADVLEHLGVVATVTSTGADAGRLADELFAFASAVKDNPELRDALADQSRSQADRNGLVRSLLEGKALPATIALAEQSLSGSHRTVDVALTAYQKVVADVQGKGVAVVRVARPLSDADAERLAAALTRQYGKEIHLNVVVDPQVIGGIKVEIGDEVIDGTVSTRLDDAGRRLAG